MKILLAISLVIVGVLLFIVFKSVNSTNSSEAVESTVVAKDESYLKDPKKLYVVKEYSLKKERDIESEQSYIGKSKGYDTWYGTDTFIEKENQKGLFYGVDKVLAYPVEQGKEWSAESFTFMIESVNETITTPAGTFDNVAVVKTIEKGKKEYMLTYYTKGVGQILREAVDATGKKTIRFELQAIKDN